MTSLTSGRPVGRAKSCVGCRQFKLACDARRMNPDPCTRCVSKNMTCTFDPHFKRISTRKINQEVANELHSLRAAHGLDGSAPVRTTLSQPVVDGGSPTTLGGVTSISSGDSSLQPPLPGGPSWIQLDANEVVLDQPLNGMIVTSTQILKLFYHFERYYYSHARFLPQVKSINRLITRSPLLFWTILLVAADRYDSYEGLHEEIYALHETLIAEILHIAIQKLEVVHALLILCLWPVVKLRNAYDTSWNYLGLAIQGATSLNCHHPLEKGNATAHFKGSSDTSAAEMDPVTQSMTWLHCFMMGARLSAYLGLPPPICPPQHSRSLKRAQQIAADSLSSEELLQIKIFTIFCDAQIHLEAIEDLNIQDSMLRTYQAQLAAVRVSGLEKWSWALEATSQSTRLYILGIGLLQEIPIDDQQGRLRRNMILQNCLDAASAYISTISSMSDQEVSGSKYPSGILSFYPRDYFTSLMASTAYLFRFLVGGGNATQSQQSLAMTRITEAHKIFQSFPDQRNAVRACITIEMFVNAIRNIPMRSADLVVRNRLGASVIVDASFWATQQRSMSVRDGANPPVSEWPILNEMDTYRLPLAPEQRVPSPLPQTRQEHNLVNGIWDTYSNDFSLFNEPWVNSDAEFASIAGMNMATLGTEDGMPYSGSLNIASI